MTEKERSPRRPPTFHGVGHALVDRLGVLAPRVGLAHLAEHLGPELGEHLPTVAPGPVRGETVPLRSYVTGRKTAGLTPKKRASAVM